MPTKFIRFFVCAKRNDAKRKAESLCAVGYKFKITQNKNKGLKRLYFVWGWVPTVSFPRTGLLEMFRFEPTCADIRGLENEICTEHGQNAQKQNNGVREGLEDTTLPLDARKEGVWHKDTFGEKEKIQAQ